MAEEDVQEAPKKKRTGLLKWLVILAVILGILGAGGWYAYTKYFAGAVKDAGGGQEGTAGEHGKDETQAKEGGQAFKDLITLPTFVVNLADPLGRRYLKLTMDVEVADAKAAEELNGSLPKVRDAVILLLSSKSYQELSTMESKIALKTEVVERLNQVLGGPKVLHVYFTEMVVQ